MTARNRTAWTFIITSAALLMGSLDNWVVTTVLPSIHAHLHARWPACSGRSTPIRLPSRTCCSLARPSASGPAAAG